MNNNNQQQAMHPNYGTLVADKDTIKKVKDGLQNERQKGEGLSGGDEVEHDLRDTSTTTNEIFLNTVRATAHITLATCCQNVGMCACRACCWSVLCIGIGAAYGAGAAALCADGSAKTCSAYAGYGAAAGAGTSCVLAYCFPRHSPLCLFGEDDDGSPEGDNEYIVNGYNNQHEAQKILNQVESPNNNNSSLYRKIFCCN